MPAASLSLMLSIPRSSYTSKCRAVGRHPLVGRKTAEGEIESATIKEGQSDAGKVKNSSVSFQMNGLISTVIEISSHCELNNSCIKKGMTYCLCLLSISNINISFIFLAKAFVYQSALQSWQQKSQLFSTAIRNISGLQQPN